MKLVVSGELQSIFRKIPNFCLLSSALHHSNNATATLLASDAVVDVILKESSSKTPLMASRKYFRWCPLQGIMRIWIKYKYNKGHLLATVLFGERFIEELVETQSAI